MRSTEKWSMEVRDCEAVYLSISVCFALDGKEDETPKSEALVPGEDCFNGLDNCSWVTSRNVSLMALELSSASV